MTEISRPKPTRVEDLDPTGAGAAGRWFVEHDSRPAAADEAAFLEWLARDQRHAAAYARCEAAVALTRLLYDDPELEWTPDGAAATARGARDGRPTAIRWHQRPALAWLCAGLAVVVAAAAWLPSREPDPAPRPPTALQSSASSPAWLLVDFGTSEPVVMLPGNVPVDARAVAVLPFAPENADAAPAPGGNTRQLASELYRRVLRQLEQIPGLYVVAEGAVAPYVDEAVPFTDMAVQLGVRGVVRARVATNDNRVQVFLTLIDASDNSVLVDDDYDRPVSDIAGIQLDIAKQIAVALASPSESSVMGAPN